MKQFDIGNIFVRRKKSSYKCGDMFIVVEKIGSGYNYNCLSINKNGHMTITCISADNLEKLYIFCGHTFNITELLNLAKDFAEEYKHE